MQSEIILVAGGAVTTLSVIGCAKLIHGACISPSEEKIEKKLFKFLEEADDAYIDMYIDKNVSYFADYATEKLCDALEEVIIQPDAKLFSTKSCRIRRWQVLSEINNIIKVRKDVVHELVTVAKGVKLPMGDDVAEVWDIMRSNKGFIVSSIRGVV